MNIEQLYKHYQQNPSVSTDTRNILKGSIFFALKGENFDGNNFALTALKNGASYSIVDNKDISKSTYEEGCLSVPNQFAEIDRPKKCDVEYLDYNGEKKILHAEGLLATCIQHEMDHLEGILFIDYLSKLKKSMIIKKLSKNKSSRIVV